MMVWPGRTVRSVHSFSGHPKVSGRRVTADSTGRPLTRVQDRNRDVGVRVNHQAAPGPIQDEHTRLVELRHLNPLKPNTAFA